MLCWHELMSEVPWKLGNQSESEASLQNAQQHYDVQSRCFSNDSATNEPASKNPNLLS